MNSEYYLDRTVERNILPLTLLAPLDFDWPGKKKDKANRQKVLVLVLVSLFVNLVMHVSSLYQRRKACGD